MAAPVGCMAVPSYFWYCFLSVHFKIDINISTISLALCSQHSSAFLRPFFSVVRDSEKSG